MRRSSDFLSISVIVLFSAVIYTFPKQITPR